MAGDTFGRDFKMLTPLGQIIWFGMAAGPPQENLTEQLGAGFVKSAGIQTFFSTTTFLRNPAGTELSLIKPVNLCTYSWVPDSKLHTHLLFTHIFSFVFLKIRAMGIRRIKSYFENRIKKVQDFFQFYTTGLNRNEVELLLKKDSLVALTYYKDKTALKDSSLEKKTFKSKIRVFKEIFLSFLMQLTPARRLF